MSLLHILAGILGLGLLIVVHETGHLLAARASGMRVIRFSIGFGPPLIRYQSKKSETLYQIALIPFLAYVQIAGMNPFEEIDPDDKGSYANASLFARVAAIIAGPLANYLFASVLFFICNAVGGVQQPSTRAQVEVLDEGPAKAANLKTGDTITAVSGEKVSTWEDMRKVVVKSPGKPLVFDVERGKERLQLTITPKADKKEGRIGVTLYAPYMPVSLKEAAVRSLVTPYLVVKSSITALARVITLQDEPDLGGPVRIVSETSKAARDGWLSFTWFLGALSAYLGGFNALPFPALDGGRLAFLAYEAVTRRKPNARIEVMVHALGFAMLLTLIAIVTFADTKKVISEASDAPASSAAPKKKPAP
ncbi:MAG: Intrarane protease RasP/YluC, implicated in cell division based on FtsL cleavage [Polyangiaceae bacterium]|nr:Intrarane protease RasP/YluC, implicated in cell division based on FtsL cleavage [Polyangiaceae bacterium]